MFGDNIKSLRNSRKLTQRALANNLSVSKSTVAMWETNKREPDSTMLNKIATYFNVSLDYLINGTDEPKTISIVDNTTDLKFALFGTSDIDDEVLEDVKKYAAVARRIREEQKGR